MSFKEQEKEMKARASDQNTNRFSVFMLIHMETKMRQNYVICYMTGFQYAGVTGNVEGKG